MQSKLKFLTLSFILSGIFVYAQSNTSDTMDKKMYYLNKINITNEYNTLKEVIVGIAPALYFPDRSDVEEEGGSSVLVKWLSKLIYPLLKGRKVPNWIAKKYQKEEAALVKVLKEYNVVIHRPDEVTPIKSEPLGLGQMYARDPVLCVDTLFVDAHLQLPMRWKESRGFSGIISKLRTNNVAVCEIPKDTGNVYLEGGDVMIDLPYIYVGIGKYASNMKGVEWLQKIVGDSIKVVPVQIIDSSILHLDCAMTLTGKQKGIIHRQSLQNPLPYPLNTYNFIEVDSKTRKQLGTNILMLNPATIVVQKRHKLLQQKLKAAGYSVIAIEFTWHALLGGAFRCATCPLVRGEI